VLNESLVLLKQVLEKAVAWGYIPTNPAGSVGLLAVPKRHLKLWSFAELRRVLLGAPTEWRAVLNLVTKALTGMRTGELQAINWGERNCANFITDKVDVTHSPPSGVARYSRCRSRKLNNNKAWRRILQSRAAGCSETLESLYQA